MISLFHEKMFRIDHVLNAEGYSDASPLAHMAYKVSIDSDGEPRIPDFMLKRVIEVLLHTDWTQQFGLSLNDTLHLPYNVWLLLNEAQIEKRERQRQIEEELSRGQ